MDVREYARVFRSFWRSITVCVLVSLIVSAALTLKETPQYQAAVQLFISTQANTADNISLSQGNIFTQQRVKSYADIVGSDSVMSAVIKDLKLQITPRELAKKIVASAPADTVLINISVKDPNPEVARATANAVGYRFANFINQLETPATGSASPVRVSVVQPAALPTSPVSPKKSLNLGLGLIIGLLIGLGQAVARASLDTTLKGSEDIAGLIEAPVVGLIPFDPDASDQPVITDVSPHSLRAEAFRQLRTNLQFIDVDQAPRSIVVTSSVPKEGKSTSTANLAITMVRSGLRVVVVEADLRKPRLMTYLGIEGNRAGLTDVLIGRVSIDEALVQNGPGGVAFMPSGTPPPNPSELLASAAMQRVIADLVQRFDIVLLDAPPLLPVTDAAVMATLADGVLLIVRVGSTRREQVARSRELLDGVDARVLGVVLNRVDRKRRDSYGYYYYYSSGEAEKRSRRSGKATDSSFTPVPIVPARPERRTAADFDPGSIGGGRQTPESVVNGAAVYRPVNPVNIPTAGSHGATEGVAAVRADSVRAAVFQAFNRGLSQPVPSHEPPSKADPDTGFDEQPHARRTD